MSSHGRGAPGGMKRAAAPPQPCHPERSEGSGRGKVRPSQESPTQILHCVQDDNRVSRRGDFLEWCRRTLHKDPAVRRAAGIAALALLAFAGVALARPGGGESYGGGSSGGSDGGGGGGCLFLFVRLWIDFCIAYPQFGIPITVVGIFLWWRYRKKHPAARNVPWDTRSSAPPAGPASRDLEAVRALDPDFSTVLFEDFAYALYARAHEARTDPAALAALAPYLSEAARLHLAARRPQGAPVSGVVVGAMRVAGLTLPSASGAPGFAGPAAALLATAAARAKAKTASGEILPERAAQAQQALQAMQTVLGALRTQVQVTLEFEANMTVGTGSEARTQYVRERWHLGRDAAARSRPPEAVGSFHCPHCGAPFEDAGGGRCQYCGEVVTDGRFDWSVAAIEVEAIEDRPPALSGTVPERGTDFPTIFHPALAARRAELSKDDPATTDAALAARLHLIYDRLNAAWTGLDLAPARPFVSDRLFDYLQYWIAAYRAQGLRNVLEGMRITDAKMVKVVRDRWYDALTYRVWGTGRDSTVKQATGEVVSGNPRADRPYSEYWTLIRSAGKKGAPRADAVCPNCGAPLAVNMAGNCEHCGALITRGDFDWVLSKIEQDDSYTG